MNPRPDGTQRFDDLEAIEAALAASNPDLYRHLALYLQVLRQVLPGRVEQACFHLATQVHPQRYAALPLPQRLALHGRLDQLIGRCSSLLTVEQLVGLAGRMALEERRRERLERRRLLERLREGQGPSAAAALADLLRDGGLEDHGPGDAPGGDPGGGPGSGPPWSREQDQVREGNAPDPGGTGSPRGPGAIGLPLGSVQLGLRPPVGLGGFGFPGPIGAGAGDLDPDPDPQPHPQFEQFELAAEHAPDQGWDPEADDDAHDDAEAEREASLSLLPLGMLPLPDGLAAGDPRGSPRPGSPWEEGRLPRDPLLLLRWLDGLEQALARRLRNLSHAINVELLRAGLSRGLLPVSLLDAAIAGQIETLGAPANLLRLQVPFGPRAEAGRLQAMAVLLRPVDLELEEPRLRTCRRRLQQHRQEVRRMAQQFRRLQRRLQAREAERLWRQDIRKSRSGTP